MKCENCSRQRKYCCLLCDDGKIPEDMDKLEKKEIINHYIKLYNVNRQLEEIIENFPDTIFVTDGKGVIIKVNRSWEKLSAIDRGRVLGHNIKDLVGKAVSESSTLAAIEQKKDITLEQYLPVSKRTSYTTSTPVFLEDDLHMVVSTNRDFNEIERLRIELKDAKDEVRLYKGKIQRLQEEHNTNNSIIAKDKKSLETLYRAAKVAQVDSGVLILGETGTGKEEYAKYIHACSTRKDKPFIRVNCGAISSTLIESELFGYEKGSFTGADKKGKKGLFEEADQGILFLDEIGELPLEMQVKLLRVIEEREILRIGATRPVKINVRILAATNRDLEEMVRENKFRKDLFYRLNVVSIKIPPLRERKDDILPLVVHFLEELNGRYGTKKTISNGAFITLKEYNWPGNVRELRNCIEEALVMSEKDRIEEQDFYINQGRKKLLDDEETDLRTRLEKMEYYYLQQAKEKYGSIRKAAEVLEIPPTTFARKIKSYAMKYEPL